MMATAFKMAYSLVVAIMLVLFVILGTRTFYDEPADPQFDSSPLAWQEHDEDLVDYHRNVFIVASVLGVEAVGAGGNPLSQGGGVAPGPVSRGAWGGGFFTSPPPPPRGGPDRRQGPPPPGNRPHPGVPRPRHPHG